MAASAASASENELNILPYVYEVMKSIEKDTNDVMQTMNELRAQFQKARECIDHLPGTQHSQEEQLRLKSILQQQLMIKTKLLMTYKTGHHFDMEPKNNGDINGGSSFI